MIPSAQREWLVDSVEPQMIRKRQFVRTVPILIIIGLAISCSDTGYLQQEAEHLQYRLQESGDAIARAVGPDREGNSLRMTWETQSERPPAAYVDWASRQLAVEYQVVSKTSSIIDFAKEAHGDSVQLRLEASPSGTGSVVKFLLQSMPG
jgi:hypothetical protein